MGQNWMDGILKVYLKMFFVSCLLVEVLLKTVQ